MLQCTKGNYQSRDNKEAKLNTEQKINVWDIQKKYQQQRNKTKEKQKQIPKYQENIKSN